MNIPNGLPTLSAGSHKPGDGKACVMEYVALLAGEEWTDQPTCTNTTLAVTAQLVNDRLDDEHRHLLVPLIGRLLGTGVNSLALNRALYDLQRNCAGWDALAAYQPYCNCVICFDAKMTPEVAAETGLRILTALIDEYDRITGRTEHHQVTDEEYANLVLAVG